MRTFVTTVIAVAMASTASFAAVGDMVSNGYGKTLEVVEQQTGSSGNTRVVLLNDKGQERMFTVKANGKVKGKGGKRLKANILEMVEADLEAAAEAAAEEASSNTTGGGKGFNLVDCSLYNGVDRIAAIPHTVIEEGIQAQYDYLDIICAD